MTKGPRKKGVLATPSQLLTWAQGGPHLLITHSLTHLSIHSFPLAQPLLFQWNVVNPISQREKLRPRMGEGPVESLIGIRSNIGLDLVASEPRLIPSSCPSLQLLLLSSFPRNASYAATA